MKKVQIIPIKNTNYYCTNTGEIVNQYGRSLKGYKVNGYTRIALSIDKKVVHIMKSRLIYETFKGVIKVGEYIHYIDGNKNNCNINNLIKMSHKTIMNQKIVKAKLSVPRNVNSIKYKQINERKL